MTDGTAAAFADGYAHKLLASPIASMIASKHILHEQRREELDNVLKMEGTAQVAMRQTKDHKEGILAFVEKRKPEFKGQ